MSGSHNDISVLQPSLIFAWFEECQGPQVHYNINDNDYSMWYYLANEIRHKKLVEKMLNMNLKFYNFVLLLFMAQLVCGMRTPLGRVKQTILKEAGFVWMLNIEVIETY
jgi:hypothetical protein